MVDVPWFTGGWGMFEDSSAEPVQFGGRIVLDHSTILRRIELQLISDDVLAGFITLPAADPLIVCVYLRSGTEKSRHLL